MGGARTAFGVCIAKLGWGIRASTGHLKCYDGRLIANHHDNTVQELPISKCSMRINRHQHNQTYGDYRDQSMSQDQPMEGLPYITTIIYEYIDSNI